MWDSPGLLLLLDLGIYSQDRHSAAGELFHDYGQLGSRERIQLDLDADAAEVAGDQLGCRGSLIIFPGKDDCHQLPLIVASLLEEGQCLFGIVGDSSGIPPITAVRPIS